MSYHSVDFLQCAKPHQPIPATQKNKILFSSTVKQRSSNYINNPLQTQPPPREITSNITPPRPPAITAWGVIRFLYQDLFRKLYCVRKKKHHKAGGEGWYIRKRPSKENHSFIRSWACWGRILCLEGGLCILESRSRWVPGRALGNVFRRGFE